MNDSVSLRSRIAPHIEALPKSGIRDFFELVNSMEGVLSLGVGEPDFATPWGIREAAIYALESGHTSYTSNLGLESLRRHVCMYVETELGVGGYNPLSECIITVGVSEALDLVLRALLSPGDEVIYHEPCFVSYSPGIRMAHAVPVAVHTHEENEFALDPADLEAAVTPKTRAILINFPNNPTGADLSSEQKEEIAAIAIRHDLIVISDEIYSELTYVPKSPSIAALPGMKERTVVLHGFSKAYAMTGFRIGFACGPADIIDAMMKIHQYSMMCAPINGQEAAVEALKHGRHAMETMRGEYFQRRNVIVNRLNRMGLKCHSPKGAFYAYPNISSTGLTSTEFAHRLLRAKGVAVVPGVAFSVHGDSHVRCAYAASMDTIENAMTRMAEFVAEL